MKHTKTATTKSNSAKTKPTAFLHTHRKSVLILTPILLLVLGVGYFIYHNQQVAQQDKDWKTKTYQGLKDIDTWFQVPGELVVDQLVDNGCGRDPSSWLGIYRTCSYTLSKVYKGRGSAEGSLRSADKAITGYGWGGYNVDQASMNRFEYFVTHREGGGLTYDWPDHISKPSINLHFFPRDDARFKDQTVQQYLKSDFTIDNSTITLNDDEYLYGVWVVGSYRE
jgi:hypothetical protein